MPVPETVDFGTNNMLIIIKQNGRVQMNRSCPSCKAIQKVNVSSQEYAFWKEGKSVQKAFPQLTPAEREIFVTGMCEDCWPHE